MLISNEFIWREDHYAFHVTSVDSIKEICKEGLKPLCGERSKSVGDNIKGVFFFDYLNSASEWIDVLYKDKNIYELELLRFNLKNRRWIKHNDDEFYLPHIVYPEKVEYLRIYNVERNINLPLTFIDDSSEKRILVWDDLNNYKPLVKK